MLYISTNLDTDLVYWSKENQYDLLRTEHRSVQMSPITKQMHVITNIFFSVLIFYQLER